MYVDIIVNVVGSEVCGEGDGTLLPEGTREGISSAGSQTVTSPHFCSTLVRIEGSHFKNVIEERRYLKT